MSEVEEAAEELIESEPAESNEDLEENVEEESIKVGASSPNELRVLVDVIDLVRKVLQGEANENDLKTFYEKVYGKT